MISLVSKLSRARVFQRAEVLSVMPRLILSAILSVAGAVGAVAAPIDTLMQSMRFGELTQVLAQEGRSISEEMEVEMGIPKVTWDIMLAKLYQAPAIEAAFRTELDAALSEADIADIQVFYDTQLGQTLVEFELEGRKALVDEAIMEAAVELWGEMPMDAPRSMQIEAYIETNDLIEMNIVSSLNSDVAYLRGFSNTVGAGSLMSENDILRDVWSSEPEVRARVSEWIYGFSVLAYEPMSDADFGDYIEFCQSQAGQALNSALFTAFDAVYEDLSYGLGAGTAQLVQSMSGSDL